MTLLKHLQSHRQPGGLRRLQDFFVFVFLIFLFLMNRTKMAVGMPKEPKQISHQMAEPAESKQCLVYKQATGLAEK